MSNHINRRLQSIDANASIGEYGTTFMVKEIYQGTDQCAMISVLQRLYPVRLRHILALDNTHLLYVYICLMSIHIYLYIL